MEEKIVYFEKSGKENTGEVIKLVLQRAKLKNISRIIKTKFSPLNCRCRTSRLGISSLHGPHQVAQKLRKIIFPLYCFISTFLPVKSFKKKSGTLLSPLIGLILIFEKRSSSRPSAAKARLTRRMKTKERERKKTFPPMAYSL